MGHILIPISQQTLVQENFQFKSLYCVVIIGFGIISIHHLSYMLVVPLSPQKSVYLKLAKISVGNNKCVSIVLFWDGKMSATFTFLFVRTHFSCWIEISPTLTKLGFPFSEQVRARVTETEGEGKRERESWSRGSHEEWFAFYI